MRLNKLFVGALSALLLGAAPTFAQDEITTFTRFVEGDNAGDAALQVAQARYVSDKTGVEVILYGVVHIAEADYYAAVQKDLSSYDVVLYEGVAPGKKKVEPDETMVNISEMQKLMCDILGLQFQKDGIDYTAKNLVHADMNADQLREAAGGDMSKALPGAGMFNGDMLKNLGPMLKMGAQFFKTFAKNNPAMRDRMKMMMGKQLGSAGSGNVPGMDGEMMRVIVVERNKVAMKVLDREMAKRNSGKMAMFYGAAHMKDFHERLVKRGFRQVEKTWKSAWTMGNGVEGGSERPKTQPKAAPKKSKKQWF